MMAERRPLAEPTDIAKYIGTTEHQLAQDRYHGRGPKFIKVGKRVRYRWEDVDAWLDANTKQCTGETQGNAA